MKLDSKQNSMARFSDKQWVQNGVHSALVRLNEELLEGEK
jgi:hypothetical protein